MSLFGEYLNSIKSEKQKSNFGCQVERDPKGVRSEICKSISFFLNWNTILLYITMTITINISIFSNKIMSLHSARCVTPVSHHHQVIILHLSIVEKKKPFYGNDLTITELGIIDSKTSSTAYVILYELIDTWFLDSNRRVGVWWLPWHWHILSIQVEEQAPKPVGWMMCFLPMTFVPVQKLCVNIYIYIYAFSICVLFFFCFINCVLLSVDNSLIPGLLWLLAFVLNNTLILGIWCSTIPHLPGCFCPWTFFQNIGFNMVPSDPFMSHLATQLGYSAGEFRALQLIVLATFGVVD